MFWIIVVILKNRDSLQRPEPVSPHNAFGCRILQILGTGQRSTLVFTKEHGDPREIMKLQLDHIAVLSESLAETEADLPIDLKRHEVETFQSEGTKEQYVELGPEGTPYLLLLESIADGPYRRTLEKRGPGLHHFGYATDNLEDGVKVFSERGLLMHPVSLETMKKSTIWLCRPGIPFLVELTQITRKIVDTQSVTKASIPNLKKDIDWMPGIHLTRSETREIHLKTRSTQLSIKT